MKSFKKLFFLGMALACLGISACNSNPNLSNASEPEPSSAEPEPVPLVFVLTGQSNMEGQTQWGNDYLKNALTNLEQSGQYPNVHADDYQIFIDGVPNIRTSYYGCGYGEIYTPSNIHASNKETPINGQFENTKVGEGYQDNAMGPEIGMACALKDYATEERPIYFIKCGISGSGFAQSGEDKINWNVEKEQNLYVNHLKPYTENCLNLIQQETGKKPCVRGFVWMQGESDSDDKKIPYYADRFNALVDKFANDFKGYAKDEDPKNIGVLDACIYDEQIEGSGGFWGGGNPWGTENSKNLNKVKMDNAAAHDNYWCVNSSFTIEGGLELKTGSPGGNSMHYSTESSLKLGLAYGEIIINNLLF